MKKNLTRILSLLLVLVLMVGVLPVSALADGWDLTGELDTEQLFERAEPVEMQSKPAVDGYDYSIMFLDCGRKYYSVDSIKKLIDNAAAAGFNYIQLAVGNDGLRFLLDDMSLTVNGTTYTSKQVSDAIHAGNEAYYNFDVDELTQSEMDTIIDYATSKGMGVIPCVNTPGHMDAILSAASSLTGKNCSYNGSARTIDVTNDTAVAFTKALLQKYITYFAGKGCQLFNMGADEYANDKFTGGSMGFGNLQSDGKYSYYVTYVNDVAAMIKNAGMTPMAFNDGIYFNNNTSSGKFDTDIIICYWSNGWNSYSPMPASDLASKGFKLVNTHGDYYWVLGKSDWQCSPTKAAGFDYTAFQGGKISNPAGAMFCIWGDYPGAETEASVISKTADTITAFGGTLPETKPGSTTPKFEIIGDGGITPTLEVGKTLTLRIANGVSANWTASQAGIVELTAPTATRSAAVTGSSVNVKALKAGDVTITATNPDDPTQTATFDLTVSGPAAPDTEYITLTVGQTDTRTQDVKLNGTYTPDPTGIASVEVTAEPVAGETTYVPVTSLTAGTFYVSTKANDNAPTVTLTLEDAGNGQYYLKDSSGQYIYPSASRYLGWQYSLGTGKQAVSVDVNNGGIVFSKHYTWGFYSTYAYLKLSGTTFGAAGSPTNLYLYTKETQPAGWKSTITFKGLAVGNTTVKIGDITYQIQVVDEAPDNTLTGNLTLEYWITNNKVYEGTTTSTPQSKTISTSAEGASTDEGIALSTLAPNSAYGFFDGTKTVYYWMTVRLDSAHKQTIEAGVDQTAVGTTLTHVRYHAGAWQYKTLDGTWTYFESGDQLVAYYLQKTTVTKDVETYVKDWGYGTGSTTPDTSSNKGQAALTIAVVYPDGTVQPTEDNMYSQATTIFNYWDSRNIGIVSPKVNENYSISKMTITDGVRTKNSSYNYWTPSDTITWNKVELESGAEWYDETVVWQKSDGTTPMVNASDEKIKAKCTWSEKNTAKLVLIYLEPIQKDTNLNIVYFDRTDNVEIQRMQVAMKYNQGDATPSYFTHLYNNGVQIAYPDKTNWPGLKASDAGYLPDSAYVVNAGGVSQTFSKDITTNVGISDKYKSGLYSYDGATISEDGKTLTLYFALDNSKLDNWYVLDFGLPIEIPVSDLVTNFQDVTAVSVKGTPLSGTPVTTDHGELTYDPARKVITYTPTTTWAGSSAASVSFNLQYTDGQKVKKDIGVIPASNILYEENFLTQAEDTNANRLPWALDTAGSLGSTKQATHKNDVEAIFGYDDAYKNSTGSNGAWKVSNLSKESSVSKPLTAEFYGNALDVIGTCDANTAMLMMIISNVDNPSAAKKPVLVDTRYNGGTLNQVPFAHVELESDAHYSVNIRAYYAPAIAASNINTATTFGAVSGISDFALSGSYADQAVWDQMARDLASFGLTLDDVEFVRFNDTASAAQTDSLAVYADLYSVQQPARPEGTNLAIDAFRVYRSSDSNDAIGEKYIASEQNIVYNNILDVVKGKILAFTEGDSNTTIQITDYEAAGGPQNEIYIGKNQAISFHVDGATEIQVSLRAVQGATSWADATTGENPAAIRSNTEMYYTVKAGTGGVFTITNHGSGLLAIVNVKLPSGAKTMSASEIDEDALRASLCAALGLSAEQPQAFQPKTFTARATTLPMLRNKRVSVLITISNDVSYVTVNGVKYTPSRYYASWQKTRLIQFGETLGKYESKTYTIIAYDANGVASAPITVNG